WESQLRKRGCVNICGVDEAGRGPLAGPVVAAAVILRPGFDATGVDDSKQLTARQREEQFRRIVRECCSYGVGAVFPEEIDRINILQASFEAMRQAIAQLDLTPDFVLVDGNKAIPDLPLLQQAIIGGDGKVVVIACASIIAKVTRDRMMCEYHAQYPQYGFDRHKGYPTPEHRRMIERYGALDIHRKSFTLLPEQRELHFAD
ncbi:MAG: ribonuclease HII, partial [candidate division Zixibacteria bacterium]|nr:ribonuclease HII [candidate division Zixibacteria bacterium]